MVIAPGQAQAIVLTRLPEEKMPDIKNYYIEGLEIGIYDTRPQHKRGSTMLLLSRIDVDSEDNRQGATIDELEYRGFTDLYLGQEDCC